jgi:RNA polymerase-binding transcription factor DksA
MDALVARRELEAERERLREMRNGSEREHPHELDTELSSLDQHQADGASDVFDREMELSIRALVDADLREVLDALRRLDDGVYGSCQICGAPIPDDRLQAVPATRFCLDHEQLAEGTGITRSVPAGMYPDGTAFADDVAGREALQHLEFLPTDDEADEDLQLGPEELALHRIGGANEPYGTLTPDDVELAEMGAFELDDDQQTKSERGLLARRAEADAAALEDEELDATPGAPFDGAPPSS